MPRPYTIARLAAAACVHVETIRYYQRLKLVPEPPRPLGGIRRTPRRMPTDCALSSARRRWDLRSRRS
ncbi:MAG TPA: MerR family DNA-binding transcriptional regulator [Steroidobacteraceae bacterium]